MRNDDKTSDSDKRLVSVLVCWVVHAGLLLFIGVFGLLIGLLPDPAELLAFYEPFVGDAVVPFANLIRLMSDGAVWVLLVGLLVAATAVGGFLRTGWGRALLLANTWVHIVGLLPLLLVIHLRVGFSGLLGVIFVVAELAAGIASIVVLKGSLGVIRQAAWGAQRGEGG